MKRFFLLVMALLLCLPVMACSGEETHFVKFTMEDGSTFVVELYPDQAPKTVANFEKLVSNGFYDGLTFHRIYAGFMIQGGDPKGDGTGGSPDKILGEFSVNPDFTGTNSISHTRGVISMARRGDSYNSASSQFFIMHADNARLDGQYAAFGRVVEGMDTVDKIAAAETTYNSYGEKSVPLTPPVIQKAELIDYEK